MTGSQPYILIAIIVLAVITMTIIFLSKDKTSKKLTPLAGIAFAFVLAGIIFGENRMVGYGLIGFGIFLAVLDIIIKFKKRL